jgi:hypothetical protein
MESKDMVNKNIYYSDNEVAKAIAYLELNSSDYNFAVKHSDDDTQNKLINDYLESLDVIEE